MTISTYLTFDGNCRDAFEFYRTVFGGDYHVLSTFADGPSSLEEEGIAEADKNKVMHVSLPVGDSVLMGSDSLADGPALQMGNNFSLSVAAHSRGHGDELLAKLSANGTVTMPMEDTFWGAYFGMCRDQFGISWMIVHETEQT